MVTSEGSVTDPPVMAPAAPSPLSAMVQDTTPWLPVKIK